jgi:hypothetical protein
MTAFGPVFLTTVRTVNLRGKAPATSLVLVKRRVDQSRVRGIG